MMQEPQVVESLPSRGAAQRMGRPRLAGAGKERRKPWPREVLEGEPEAARQLWAAVVARAAADARGETEGMEKYPELVRDQARAWFSSGRMEVGSFLWACQAAGLDPEAVRRYALAAPRRLGKFGENVRRFRERRGWTQMLLSAAAGIDNSVLSHIERGRAHHPVARDRLLAFIRREDPAWCLEAGL